MAYKSESAAAGRSSNVHGGRDMTDLRGWKAVAQTDDDDDEGDEEEGGEDSE
jgi:hypothetical protein